MILWLVLPRSNSGDAISSISDKNLVEIMLLSQAIGVAAEITLVLAVTIRCVVSSISAASANPPTQTTGVFPRQEAAHNEGGLSFAGRAQRLVSGAAHYCQAGGHAVGAIAVCSFLTRFFTWINGAACGAAYAAMKFAQTGNAAAADASAAVFGVLLWSLCGALALLSAGSGAVGIRSRARASLAEYAINAHARSATTAARRRVHDSVETEPVLRSTNAFRALDLASRGGSETSGLDVGSLANTLSLAMHKFEEYKIAALRAESVFYFTISFVAGALAAVTFFIVKEVTTMYGPVSSGLPLDTIIEELLLLASPPTLSKLSSPSTTILCWVVGWHLIAMASLVSLARSLQGSWDADDALAHLAVVGTESQARAAAAASDAQAAGTGACVPLTLEKIADGVYRRTREDVAGRLLGLQLLSNPLHDLLNAQRALVRQASHGTIESPRELRGRTLLLATGSGSARVSHRASSAESAGSSCKAPGSLVIRSPQGAPHSRDFECADLSQALVISDGGSAPAPAQRAAPHLPILVLPMSSIPSTAGAAGSAELAQSMTPHAAGARPSCFVCYEQAGDSVFMECGHAGACTTCAETIVYGHTKRKIVTREALAALSATGAKVRILRSLAEGVASSLSTERAEVESAAPPASSVAQAPPPQAAQARPSRPAGGLEQAAQIIAQDGRVPWLQNVVVSASALEALVAAQELAQAGELSEAEMRLQVSSGIRSAARSMAGLTAARNNAVGGMRRRQQLPPGQIAEPAAGPPAPGAHEGSPSDKFLVSVELGGSGACPVCRGPVSSLLRIGPDVTTTDGRTVAIVLPLDIYWSHADQAAPQTRD